MRNDGRPGLTDEQVTPPFYVCCVETKNINLGDFHDRYTQYV